MSEWIKAFEQLANTLMGNPGTGIEMGVVLGVSGTRPLHA